ncbi:GID complex subunit containing RING finger motif [Thoreauomyces humboldtii]|nr:GID complex subunit containing RING finger motif [Thoreauomyces humboldtii]
MEKTKLNHEGLFNLEQPLLKVPAEQLKKAARTSQRFVEYVMKEVTSEVGKLAKTNSTSAEQAAKSLDGMVERLQKLKRKLSETKADEHFYVQRTKARLSHLKELMEIPTAESPAGYGDTARKLASETHIEDLVDVELFAESRQVEDALENRNCAECLKWCTDNRSSLEKIQSTLEFSLRLQEYVELARQQRKEEAIRYCRKYLVAWQSTHMRQIQQAMALLAFAPDTTCQPYSTLWDESRWEILIDQFRADNHALHNLTSQPLLTMTLQAGLSALKTPACYTPADRTINCPVCAADTFGQLAKDLPCAHHVNSCIVDRISGTIMDEDNPPLVLPNGYVYSTKSLQALAADNSGNVKCARTGEAFHISEARRAFVL